MGWKSFNDRLALLLIIGMPLLWCFDGLGWLTLKPEIIGAMIVTWTLVTQFYFRKAPPTGGSNGNS